MAWVCVMSDKLSVWQYIYEFSVYELASLIVGRDPEIMGGRPEQLQADFIVLNIKKGVLKATIRDIGHFDDGEDVLKVESRKSAMFESPFENLYCMKINRVDASLWLESLDMYPPFFFPKGRPKTEPEPSKENTPTYTTSVV